MKLLSILLVLGLAVAAGFAGDANPWNEHGGASRKFKTAVGEVFDLPALPFQPLAFMQVAKSRIDDRAGCKCPVCTNNVSGAALSRAIPAAKRRRDGNILIVQFQFRLFPALQNQNDKPPVLLVGFSDNAQAGSDWSLTHTMVTLNLSPLPPNYLTPFCAGRREQSQQKLGHLYLPRYGWQQCRIIFRLQEDGCELHLNGCRIRLEPQTKRDRIPVFRSIRLGIPPGGEALWEISPPHFLWVADEKQVEKLQEQVLPNYPYGGLSEIKRIRNNPDWLYAAAQKESNPVSALALLKQAAKKDHVFASYQLAEWYLRGIGVPPDSEKALKWLNDAEKLQHPDARALDIVIRWKRAGHYLKLSPQDHLAFRRYFRNKRGPSFYFSESYMYYAYSYPALAPWEQKMWISPKIKRMTQWHGAPGDELETYTAKNKIERSFFSPVKDLKYGENLFYYLQKARAFPERFSPDALKLLNEFGGQARDSLRIGLWVDENSIFLKDWDGHLKLILREAQAGNEEWQRWIAFLTIGMPDTVWRDILPTGFRRFAAELVERKAKSANPPEAAWQWLILQSHSALRAKDDAARLEALTALNYGPAWLLTGQYREAAGAYQAAHDAYLRAAAAGLPDGLRASALLWKQQGKNDPVLWRRFIQADAEQRMNDLADFFDPECTVNPEYLRGKGETWKSWSPGDL